MKNQQSMSVEQFEKFGLELVLVMTKALVDQPEQVSVQAYSGENTTVFQLHVAQGELGQVLGKRGCNIDLMRKILQIYAAKSKRRAVLELADPAQSESKKAA